MQWIPSLLLDSRLMSLIAFFFFFNDTATTEIYTLSLHDALPICRHSPAVCQSFPALAGPRLTPGHRTRLSLVLTDRKSTRLNSSHANISYAVFCLKKKRKEEQKLEGSTQDVSTEVVSQEDNLFST